LSPLMRIGLTFSPIAVLCAGCVHPPETHVPLDQLVAEHNANARLVPRLWARAKIHLIVSDEKGNRFRWGSTSPFAGPNGILLLGKSANPLGPHDFVLIGRETLAVDLFRVGSSASEGKYYLWYRYGDHARAYWGRSHLAGAPGIREMPIEPNQLLSVLGICELPRESTDLPAVIMRMSATPPYSYVVAYIDREAATGRIVCKKEIHFSWDDSDIRRAFMVKLFDARGDEVMTAKLGEYRPIETDPHIAPRPVMPTDIRIAWPDRGTEVHLLLSEMTTAETWQRDACRFLDPETGAYPTGIAARDVVQVDRDLDAGGEGP